METYMAVNFHKPVEKDFLVQKFGILFIKYPLHNPRCTNLIFKKNDNNYRFRIFVKTESGDNRCSEMVFKEAFWIDKFQNEKCKISEMKFKKIIKWNRSLKSF